MMPAANSYRSIALWLLRGATAMVKTAMFMAMFKATVMAAVVTVAVAATAAAHAASFDCTKARSKLNRMICADAALSALDSQVWDTFGAHLKTLSPAQLAHVRERHLIWRRQRGWFDDNIAAIAEDYRRHLAWLSHPLLPLEGRYESEAGHVVRVEVDAGTPGRVSVQGEAAAPGAFAWVVPIEGELENQVVREAEAGSARPALPLNGKSASLSPVFLGAPAGPVQQCRIEMQFHSDKLELATQGACGTSLSGVYRKPLPAVPFWAARQP